MIEKPIDIQTDDGQRMSSLEMAAITQKPHNDLMKAIRKMEIAWQKITQGNFSLSTYKDSTGRQLPCYLLTKSECLYVATKFNDEARAKLVLRWMELETRERERQKALMEAYESDAEYAHEVLQSHGTLTATQIAKELGMSARKLNMLLHERGVIFKQSGEWQLYARYQDMGLMDKETFLVLFISDFC